MRAVKVREKGWFSGDVCEADLFGEFLDEGFSDIQVFGLTESGVGVNEFEGVFSCEREQVEVFDDVCDLQVRQSVLTCAEKLSRAAEL